MTDLAAQYGIAGIALALALILAHLLWQQYQQQRKSGNGSVAVRIDMITDLKEDVRATRLLVEALRDVLQKQVRDQGVLEWRLSEIERRLNISLGP